MKHAVNSIVPRCLSALLLAAALWLGPSASSRAGDVSLVILSKGQSYLQTNATTTILAMNRMDGTNIVTAFNIFALVQGTGVISSVSAFNVANPSDVVDFSPEDDRFVYDEYAASNAELEEFLPPGSYGFTIVTGNDGTLTPTLTVPATAYPNIPRLLNWADAQNADPLADFTLHWTPMSGGSAQDFILVNIDGGGDDHVFSTPFLGEAGQLTGQSNSVVIPAGTLAPGHSYGVNITFVNVPGSGLSTNTIPGAKVGVGFVRETEVTITTEDIPPQGRIKLASTNLTIIEGNPYLDVTLIRVGGSQGEATVRLRTADLTATAGADYGGYDEQLSFEEGETNVTVRIQIYDDYLLEGSERFRLGLSGVTGATLTRDTNAVVTIIDNETGTAGKLSFSAAAYQVIESNTTVNIIVRREGGTTGEVGGSIQIFGGTADYGDDYEPTSGETMTFSIPAGKSSATNVINILDDDEAEGNETILMRLADPTGGAILGRVTTNTTTILDDENAFAFEVARSTNIENQASAVITVIRTGSTLEDASVDYTASVEELSFAPSVDADYATSGVDFLGTTGTLVFPKGVAKKNFTVRILDDLALESTEVIRLALRNPTNAQLGELDSALLYIKDNDLAGTVNFVMTNQNVKESVGGAKIMVIRTGGLASNIIVRLSTQAGTATDAADYIGFSSNLVFSGREVKKTIPLSVIQDALVEPTENLTLTLSGELIMAAGDGFSPARISGQYADLGTKTTLTVNIADDDKGGVISFDKAALSVNESVTNLAIILKRTGGAASNVTVRLQSAGGSLNPATAGSDYTVIDTVVTFGPGETRKTNHLHIINDSIADALLPETIGLSLREFTGGAKPGLSNAVVAIIDDEASVSFVSSTSSGVENRTVTLTVVRGGFLGSTGTVDYMFMDGTATNGLDYVGTAGTLVFLPRQVSKTITVSISTDPVAESTPETFTVILKNATNILLGTITTNTVSITDAPAVGAISGSGSAFFKAKIQGIEGNTLSKTIDINNNVPDVISSGYTVSLGWLQLSGLDNKFGSSFPVRTVNN